MGVFEIHPSLIHITHSIGRMSEVQCEMQAASIGWPVLNRNHETALSSRSRLFWPALAQAGRMRVTSTIMQRAVALPVLVALFLMQAKPQSQTTKPAAPDQSMPEGNGVYLREGTSGWIKLERAKMADSKAHGMGHFIDTNGMTRLSVTLSYGGAQAKVQISASKPTFFVRGTGASQEALIVQLARKKDSRETKINSTEATFDNKMGFKRGEIRRVTTSALSKGSFTVTPDEGLKPGEYLLVLGGDDTVFDFGVRSPEK